MPTRPADGDIADFTTDEAGLAELHPANTRQEDLGKHASAIVILWFQVNFDLLRIGIAHAVALPLLLESGESLGIAFVKGVLQRPVQKLQRLLLGVDGGFGQKAESVSVPPGGQALGPVPLGQDAAALVQIALLNG